MRNRLLRDLCCYFPITSGICTCINFSNYANILLIISYTPTLYHWEYLNKCFSIAEQIKLLTLMLISIKKIILWKLSLFNLMKPLVEGLKKFLLVKSVWIGYWSRLAFFVIVYHCIFIYFFVILFDFLLSEISTRIFNKSKFSTGC